MEEPINPKLITQNLEELEINVANSQKEREECREGCVFRGVG